MGRHGPDCNFSTLSPLSLHRVTAVHGEDSSLRVSGQAATSSPAPFYRRPKQVTTLKLSHLWVWTGQPCLLLEAVLRTRWKDALERKQALLPCSPTCSSLTLVMVMLMICVVRRREERVFRPESRKTSPRESRLLSRGG